MAEQYPIVGVSPPEHWSGNYGPMVSYQVLLAGEPEPVGLNQKPETPAPQIGQSLFGDIWVDQAGRRKFKKAQAAQNGAQATLNGSSASSDSEKMSKADWDAKDARIMWESVIRSAAMLVTAAVEKGELDFIAAIDKVPYVAGVWAAKVKAESRQGTGDPEPDFSEPVVVPQPVVEHVAQPGVAVSVPADEPLTTPFD